MPFRFILDPLQFNFDRLQPNVIPYYTAYQIIPRNINITVDSGKFKKDRTTLTQTPQEEFSSVNRSICFKNFGGS